MILYSADDHRFMSRALQLAERGRYSTSPNPRVGCVITQGGHIVGEGFHAYAGKEHAEIGALRDAKARHARGDTMYVTLEPCSHYGQTPPCVDAVIESGVRSVFIAMEDPNPLVAGRGIAQLRDAGIVVSTGLLADAARALNPGFISRMCRQRPFVRLKLAGSLDGRTAMASGESQWITGEAARQDNLSLRAQSGAIVTGVGTVLQDNPALNSRYLPNAEYAEPRMQPIRVIIDSRLRVSAEAKILSLPGQVKVLTTSAAASISFKNDNVEVVRLETCRQGKVDLRAAMKYLAQCQINDCHVECGATLAAAFLQQGLVDELVYYMAPDVMGCDAKPMFALSLPTMADKIMFEVSTVNRIGRDLKLVLKPV